MRRRACVGAAVAIATLVLLAGPAATPAAAEETTFSETCSEVFGRGPAGDLDKSTNPTPDSMVAPGQTIDVTLRWPNKFVAGDRPHRLIECATTNGGAPWQWAERRMVSAEGTTTLSVAVPSGSDAGSKVCAQSILVTKGSFGPVRRWSETTCHRVAAVEKKAMAPLVRRDEEGPTTSTTSEDEEGEEEKRRKEEEKRRKEEEARRKEEERRRKEQEKETTTTVKTEVTLPPSTSPSETTTSSTAPAPVVAPSPPPTRAPLAAPAPPPPKAPVVSAGRPGARPQAGGAPPAGQLARTGTGVLGLFILGAITLTTGRLLRRAFPARGCRSKAPETLPEDAERVPDQP
jgi:hypothetical protein